MKKFLVDNFLLVSFIISFCLHTILYTYGGIFLSKSKKEIRFQKLTFVSIPQNLKQKDIPKEKDEDVKEEDVKEIVEKEVIPEVKDIPKLEENIKKQEKEIVEEEQDIKKQEEIIQNPFSSLENENPPSRAAGGGAEILTSISEDAGLSNSSGSNFVVQNVPKGKGKGIGLGGKGSGIGVGGDEKGSGIGVGGDEKSIKKVEKNYNPPKVDKEKILKEYLAKIIEKIEKNKKYPEYARKENIEGKTEVKITISKTGDLKEVKIVSSSGYKILDETAIATVKKASPFLSIPEELKKENLNIKLKIVFKLEELEEK